MTDRNPDDLYDALRDRLADYGQEPPAQLWAGIRAQLPPPVAQPRLRSRRQRRLAPLGLLLLLLAGVSGAGAGWHWWQTYRGTNPAAGTTGAAATARRPAPKGHRPLATGPAPAADRDKTAFPRKDQGQGGAAAPAPSIADSRPERQLSTGPATTLAAAPAPGGATVRPARPARALASAGARPASQSARTEAAATIISGTAGVPGRAGNAESWAAAPTATRATAKARALPPPTARPRRSSSTDAPRADGAAIALAAAVSSAPRPDSSAPAGALASAAATQPAASEAGPARPAQPLARRTAESRVPARTPTIEQAGFPAIPPPQPVSVELSALPAPVGGRWAVQLLAGPALTFRQLGPGPQPAGMAAPTSVINGLPGTRTLHYSARMATLERPALAGGAQVSVRRTLSRHWTVGAGLGYAEYATRLTIEQVYPVGGSSAIPTQPLPGPSFVQRRDTYRFATLPLRAGYGWAPAGRWRVGLLAGFDAALCVGGSSPEGRIEGSPGRRFNLAASLGADFRYRLSGRWEVLAQPMASYFLLPLAADSPDHYPRRPFGGTALLGVSLDLP